MDTPTGRLPNEAMEELWGAKRLLETEGLAARVLELAGRPIERALAKLPAKASELVAAASQKSLAAAASLAIGSLPSEGRTPSRWDPRGWLTTDVTHDLAVIATGGAGGLLGLAGLPLELPLTTTLMLRSIAAIGRAEGEELAEPKGRLACVEVFALGGRQGRARESGYFSARAVVAREVTEAARYLAAGGAVDLEAPAIVRFLSKVAERFGVSVSERAAAMAVPVIGALGGAWVNHVFIDHYQRLAHGHFVIRRLERRHGEAAVREAYEALGAGPEPAKDR